MEGTIDQPTGERQPLRRCSSAALRQFSGSDRVLPEASDTASVQAQSATLFWRSRSFGTVDRYPYHLYRHTQGEAEFAEPRVIPRSTEQAQPVRAGTVTISDRPVHTARQDVRIQVGFRQGDLPINRFPARTGVDVAARFLQIFRPPDVCSPRFGERTSHENCPVLPVLSKPSSGNQTPNVQDAPPDPQE